MKNQALYMQAHNAVGMDDSAEWDPAKAVQLLAERGHHRGFITTGIPKLDAMVKASKIRVTYSIPSDGHDSPETDSEAQTMRLPYPDAFTSMDAYARTVAHELAHGVAPAVGQDTAYTILDHIFTDRYAIEEVVAESTALLVLNALGETTSAYSLAYLKGWLTPLDEVDRYHIGGTSEGSWDLAQDRAQERADYLLNLAR